MRKKTAHTQQDSLKKSILMYFVVHGCTRIMWRVCVRVCARVCLSLYISLPETEALSFVVQ